MNAGQVHLSQMGPLMHLQNQPKNSDRFWQMMKEKFQQVLAPTILCLTSRTTVTSARIPEEDACHRTRN